MELITSFLCMTKDLGINSNLFGGVMLSYIDQAAAVYVTEKCYTPHVVTGTIDRVVFKHPVKVGDIIKIYGNVTKIGNTSIYINIEARNFSPYTHEEKIVCNTEMIFVRIDPASGTPIPISKHVKSRFEHSLVPIEVTNRVRLDAHMASKFGYDDEIEGEVIDILDERVNLPIVVVLDDGSKGYFQKGDLINLTNKKIKTTKKQSVK